MAFSGLILFAISISVVRIALNNVSGYKPEIETVLSEQLGTAVTIGSVRAVLNGFIPELGLYQLQILSAQNNKPALQLKKIQITFDVRNLIYKPWIESLKVSLIGAKLSVKRLESGAIAISGLPSSPESEEEPLWLMQGNQYNLIDSDIQWEDKKRHTKPIQLKKVNVSINNTNGRHKVAINAILPKEVGTSLSLMMDFTGDIFTAESIDAELFATGKNINFNRLDSGDLPFNFSITRGHGDFSLWSTWHKTQMIDLSGSVYLRNALLQDKKQAWKHLQLDDVALNLKLNKTDRWNIAIENSHISSHNITLRLSQVAFALQRDDKGALSVLAMSVPYLNLGHVSKIINRNPLLPKEIRSPTKALALEGELKQLQLYAQLSEQKLSIKAGVNKLSFKAYKGIPGVQNLSFKLLGTEKVGKLSLGSEQLGVHFHKLFRGPLYLTQLKGDIFWQQNAEHWALSGAKLQLDTQDIKTKNKLKVRLAKSGLPPELDLRTYFYDGKDVANIHKYLPVGIMAPGVVEWLDNAFLSGSVKQGGVLVRGALADMPFIEHQGVFEVLIDVHELDLQYATTWKPLHDINAQVRFFSSSLAVAIHEGLADEAKIKSASVSIKSLNSSHYINIDGDIDGKLPHVFNYLKRSPLKNSAARVSKNFILQGDVALNLDLKIPLFRGLESDVAIKAKLKHAEATIMPSQIKLKNLNGTVLLTEHSVTSDDLQAQIFGFPAEARLSSDSENIYAAVSGLVNVEQLALYQPSQFWQTAEGQSHYKVDLQMPKDSSADGKLQIYTDLEGIAINFPPFSKTAQQKNKLSAELNLGELGIMGGHFVYENTSSEIDRLDVNVKQINANWQGLFYSPFAQGSFFIPTKFDNQSLLNIQLAKLNLSALGKLKAQAIDEKSDEPFLINKLPKIQLESEQLNYQGKNFGRLNLKTEPTKDGLLIKQLSLLNEKSKLDLSGAWSQIEGDKTQVKGDFKHQNFGRMLRNLKLSENLHQGKADIQFDLHWQDTPYKLSTENVSGEMRLQVEKGRLLGVEPGLGRILGGLDVWKLMDRLSMDFSDITLEGLSFKEMRTDLSVDRGHVETSKLYINAMPAKIYISGETDLSTHDVDLNATVLPKFPIAGTIIGNIANSVTKAFIGDEHAGGLLLSLRYDITGTWEDVSVDRLFTPFLQDKIRPELKSPAKIVPESGIVE